MSHSSLVPKVATSAWKQSFVSGFLITTTHIDTHSKSNHASVVFPRRCFIISLRRFAHYLEGPKGHGSTTRVLLVARRDTDTPFCCSPFLVPVHVRGPPAAMVIGSIVFELDGYSERCLTGNQASQREEHTSPRQPGWTEEEGSTM